LAADVRMGSKPEFTASQHWRPLHLNKQTPTGRVVEPREIDHASIQTAIQDWRATPKAHGNETFFILGRKLRNAGMDFGQIASTLDAEARHGRSPFDRKAQIPGIIETLAKRKTKT
jgi:hypothetical protein